MISGSCLYEGMVIHKRLRPKPHGLGYRVFSMLLDVDGIGAEAQRLRLFSYNRWNVISFHDRDHGGGEGKSVAVHARETFAAAGLGGACGRVFLLCYPRVLGYGFNPISVYYGYDANQQLSAVIYEVNNTFGERRSYVAPIREGGEPGGIHQHGCRKALYVSPFTDMDVDYSFRLGEPGRELVLGVNLRDAAGPLLKTHFLGHALPLTDRALARLLIALPLLTLKVTAAIHFEALRLWLKGVPLTVRPKAERYGVTRVAPSAEQAPLMMPPPLAPPLAAVPPATPART